jgi:hypothetical protein
VGDNATAKQLRGAFDAQAFAWFEGTYHNFLALYSSASRHLERRAVAHVEARKPPHATTQTGSAVVRIHRPRRAWR